MGKICVLSLGLLTFACTLYAAPLSVNKPAPSSPPLQGLRFGEAPLPDMICLNGLCMADSSSEERTNRIFSSYNKPVDLTHFGGVAITSPQYDYFENQLFRISFQLRCRVSQGDACMESVADELDRTYGLTAIQDAEQETFPGRTVLTREFRTDAGAVVSFSRDKIDGQWQQPLVRIYDLPLMDSVRESANPRYRPNGRW